MGNYLYQAVNHQGDSFNGNISADSREKAAELLQQQGLFITSLQKDYIKCLKSFFGNSMDERELVMVCRQLSVMLKSGVPLGNAVQLISQSRSKRNDNGSNDIMGMALKEIYMRLQEGSSFSNALAGTGIFPQPMIAAVAAGEAGGILEEVLERETASVSRNYQAREKLKTAMIYPVFLLSAAAVLIGIMLLVVLPVFASLFNDMAVPLPLPTRIILHIHDIFIRYGMFLPILFGLIIFLLYYLGQKEKYQLEFYRLLLYIPLLGRLMSRLELQRWLETMSLLLSGGVVIVDAVKISSNVFNNRYLKFMVKNFGIKLRRGEVFSQVIKNIFCVDDFIIELIRAGEISGELPYMLSEASLLCSIEADTLLKRIESMIEPAIILFIGIITGFLVISILMPIMEMMTLYS